MNVDCCLAPDEFQICGERLEISHVFTYDSDVKPVMEVIIPVRLIQMDARLSKTASPANVATIKTRS